MWQSLSTGGKIGAVAGGLGAAAGIVAAYVAALSGPGGFRDKLGGLIFVTVFVLAVFQAEVQTLIDRLDVPACQPGAVVAVRYDPRKPSKVALDQS